MKQETITEYVTDDGTRFRNLAFAEAWETEFKAVSAVMSALPECLINHGRYVQHDLPTLFDIRRKIWALVLFRYGERYPEWKTWEPEIVNFTGGGFMRVMDDIGVTPVGGACIRLARIDFKTGREYDRVYFVNHPDETKPQSKPRKANAKQS